MWCSAGRSGDTRARAQRAGMQEAVTLAELVERCDVIVSVCPPDSAVAVADSVAALDFDGIYVDANAVAPATVRRIGERFGRFVDGGIVGPPAHAPGTTRLYLAGPAAAQTAELWAGSALDARPLDTPIGSASALKIAYAAWTKISTALLLDVRALARAEGVEAALLDEWGLSQPGTGARSDASAAAAAPKAWRWVGEMHEIAASFEAAGLPAGFATTAGELYQRLAGLRHAEQVELDEVLAVLLARA
jgi:3-hydroxyisobutyrate dehydrogenase-like beta-hydroxyacid dehydrogenase